MTKTELAAYLEKIDRLLDTEATLYIYGSAACMLLDQPGRTSMDMDVAGPYSKVDQGALRLAAAKAEIPVNPADDYPGNHIEWVGPLRLCLPPPHADRSLLLWQGQHLRVMTGSIADLIASKLIRYDRLDQGDIRYLLKMGGISHSSVAEAAKRLPAPFATDPVVRDNLGNLGSDMVAWGWSASADE